MRLNSSRFVPLFPSLISTSERSSSGNVISTMMPNVISISVPREPNYMSFLQDAPINSSNIEPRPAPAMPVHSNHAVPRAAQDAD